MALLVKLNLTKLRVQLLLIGHLWCALKKVGVSELWSNHLALTSCHRYNKLMNMDWLSITILNSIDFLIGQLNSQQFLTISMILKESCYF